MSKLSQKKLQGDENLLSQSSEKNNWDNRSSNKVNSSLRKSMLGHFPNLEHELVFKRYSCALANDFLRQGYLFATENYLAFYSNIFGYVTKLIIPLLSIESITKEKTVKIIPNAIGINTGKEKHIFTSFIQREKTLVFLNKIWQTSKNDLRHISDFDSDSSSFYSSEEELPVKEVLPVKDALSDVQLNYKDSPIPTKRKPTKSHGLLYKAVLFTTFVIILLSIATSGILLYKIKKVQIEHSFRPADVENFKSDYKIFQENPNLYSESYLSINEYMDKNINVVADVRKSLESLSKVLNDGNKSTKD